MGLKVFVEIRGNISYLSKLQRRILAKFYKYFVS